jgi:hypothetical protein
MPAHRGTGTRTMTLRSEPSELSETMRSSLRSRRNSRPTVTVSPCARGGFDPCELTMCFSPSNRVESERRARFMSSPRDSIVG